MTTLDDIIGRSQHDSLFSRIKRLPAFWVFTAALLACLALTLMTDTFASERNLFNVARNFAFVAIIAIGMTAVIASGGIDLSVGSSVVLSAMVISVAMSSGLPFWISAILALGAALAVGLFNGILIAYAGMPAFVVTLGTLSAARSLAMVLSDNKMIWEFGPDHDILLWIGGGSTFGLPHPLYVLTILTIVMSLAFKWSRWGQHLFAIGSNENAAILTGIRGQAAQGQHLHVLRLHRRIGRHPDGRLARQRHHQSRPGNGTHGHCRRRHWRRQPCRWRGDSIWSRRRRPVDRGYSQLPHLARHLDFLAGNVHRYLHHRCCGIRPIPEFPILG
jgi:hypothetical protein